MALGGPDQFLVIYDNGQYTFFCSNSYTNRLRYRIESDRLVINGRNTEYSTDLNADELSHGTVFNLTPESVTSEPTKLQQTQQYQ